MNDYFNRLKKKDIIVVAAAGNSGNTKYNYPASYQSVISVASISQKQKHSSFSQKNDQIELSAPGVSIKSTVPKNKYASKDGTSMAAPFVAGVAALLRMASPKCTSSQLRKALVHTAKDLGDAGCDSNTGFGLVQAFDAFKFLEDNGCDSLKGAPIGGCYEITVKANVKKKKSNIRTRRRKKDRKN